MEESKNVANKKFIIRFSIANVIFYLIAFFMIAKVITISNEQIILCFIPSIIYLLIYKEIIRYLARKHYVEDGKKDGFLILFMLLILVVISLSYVLVKKDFNFIELFILLSIFYIATYNLQISWIKKEVDGEKIGSRYFKRGIPVVDFIIFTITPVVMYDFMDDFRDAIIMLFLLPIFTLMYYALDTEIGKKYVYRNLHFSFLVLFLILMTKYANEGIDTIILGRTIFIIITELTINLGMISIFNDYFRNKRR